MHTKRSNGLLRFGLSAILTFGSIACASDDDASSATSGAGGVAGNAGVGGASGVGGVGGATGGSGGAGAMLDAAVDGSESDASASDPCESALFCESFEDYAAGSQPGGSWTVRANSAEVNVVDDQQHGGAKSVRFSVAAGGFKGAFIHLEEAAVFPVAGNAYFGRMMFRLESAPETAVHWTFIQSSGLVAGETYHTLYRYGGQHPVVDNADVFVGNQLMANFDTPDSYGSSPRGPSSDCWLHADKKVVPVGRWACAEWQFDGPNNTMRFWLDGEPLEDLTMSGQGQGCVHQPATYAWTAPTFEDLDLGWESYQTDDPRTLYIDDVVLATARIGCDGVLP